MSWHDGVRLRDCTYSSYTHYNSGLCDEASSPSLPCLELFRLSQLSGICHLNIFLYQGCRKVMKSGGGGKIFDYDLGGSGGMPPEIFFGVFVL